MNSIGPLGGLPVACALTPGAGRDQIERWRAFDDEHALDVERTETRRVVHYARTDDSVRRLRELVAVESSCCSFVNWRIEDDQQRLRLVVTGSAEQLTALDVGQSLKLIQRPFRAGQSKTPGTSLRRTRGHPGCS